jgi:TonB family protein
LAGPPARAPSPPSAPLAAVPRLALDWALDWKERRRNFATSLSALLRGPAAPRKFLGDPYFRDCWVSGRGPRGAFVVSLGWHAIFVMLLIPLWNVVIAVPPARPHVQITWYGPVNDLPLILPATPVKPRIVGNRPQRAPKPPTEQQDPQSGADAFHPRQTILNAPMRPNHPRQTLIQPATAPEPPKILPEMPNIVAWSASAPPLRMDPSELARLRPRAQAARAQQDVAAPEVSGQQLAGIHMEAPEASLQKPALPVGVLSAPRAKATRVAAENAPEVDAYDGGSLRLIALSATPAPVAPPALPAGNLSSRVAISPEGSAPGTPSSAAGTAKAGTGPPGLSITGSDKSSDRSSVSSLGGGSANRTMPGTTAAAEAKSVTPARKSAAENAASTSLAERMRPGARPEALLGGKRIYTLHVNMPNLTSASGSWILSFAELAPPEAQANAYTNPADLAAPEPLRKVDPKYPPELRREHVQGEVVLYAVIRADGTVDSIQLVTGIDPALDANAMEALAQWKFQPAQRKGEAVELETIVHIPFRSEVPTF